MKNAIISLAVGGLLLLSGGLPSLAGDTAGAQALKIDIPVDLKEAKVVFNMDHPAFVGDSSIGLTYMKLMTQTFDRSNTKYTIKAVFHGAMGYMLLNDAAYNRVRKSDKGNPFKEAIADLQKSGVEFEECGQTAKNNNWTNADLLSGIKVNAGANLRIIQLVQDGYVQLQP
jgi:intracellular sulfur oxidation DsrE/DsrF family protein